MVTHNMRRIFRVAGPDTLPTPTLRLRAGELVEPDPTVELSLTPKRRRNEDDITHGFA